MILKSTLCTALMLISSLGSWSQNKLDIDSLITAYQRQQLDTAKIKTTNHIVNYYMYRQADSAKQYIDKLVGLSKQLDYISGQSLGYYQYGVYFNNKDQIDSAKFYYNKSLVLANQLNNGVYKSKVYRGLAILEFSQGNLIAADSINNLDLANTLTIGDTMGVALAYDLKGSIYQNQGYYSLALENTLKGLNLFEILGDSIRIADSYNHLATLEYSLENFQNSLENNQKALKIYQAYNDTYYQANSLNDIGIMLMNLGKEDEALAAYNQSLELSEALELKSTQAATHTNIGSTYIRLEDYPKAILALEKSIALAQEVNGNRRIALSRNMLAKVYIALKQPNQAIKLATQALAYANQNNNISIARAANDKLSSANQLLGNNTLALDYYKQVKTLSDSILNKEQVQIIEEQRIAFDTQKKEAALALQAEQIARLNAQTKNDRLTKTLYVIGIGSLLVILGLLYFGFTQRIKKNSIAREKQEAILKQEIEFKKKELASQTLHLVQKNTFIQDLKENLEKIKQSPELFKIEFRRIVMLLKRQSADDKDWEVFKSYFSEVHNNFDQTLRAIYSEITEKEIRLASFLRMNLTTKEIASMLNVLPDSVLKSKYRLKKKLGLPKNQDLSTYLNTL